MEPYYEIRHMVGFEETNLVGNVYYVNYLRWQGRCREMFLLERAPAVLAEIRDDLKLFTLKCECEFFMEITAFDELSIRMRLEDLTQTQIGFAFEYVRLREGVEELVARGRQRIACMRGPNTDTKPARVPESLRKALAPYAIASVANSSAASGSASGSGAPASATAPAQESTAVPVRAGELVDVVGKD